MEEPTKNGMLLLNLEDGKVASCTVLVEERIVANIPLANLVAMIERFNELKKIETA